MCKMRVLDHHDPNGLSRQLRYKRGTKYSPLLSRADGVTQIKAAIDGLLASDGGTVTVTNRMSEFAGLSLVEIRGRRRGSTGRPMFRCGRSFRVTGRFTQPQHPRGMDAGSPGFDGKVPFEVEIDIADDENDDDSPSRTIKLWQIDVTLIRPLSGRGLRLLSRSTGCASRIPKSFLPYHQSQLSFFQKGYAQVVGAA